jgi:hypothetical protein
VIKPGSGHVCDPRPQERVLAAYPDAVCKRQAPGVSVWRVRAAGRLLGTAYSATEAWQDAARNLQE